MESRELDHLREKGIEVKKKEKEQIIEEKDEENKSLFGRLKRRNTMEEDTSKLDNNGKKSPVTKARRLARDDEVERLKAECRSLREPPEVKAGGVSRSRSSNLPGIENDSNSSSSFSSNRVETFNKLNLKFSER
ncbi:12483_t:CDS:2 [Rhizophagus irregularis]|nr:12483_t:CDS:2 [Rhizophagus irregularis]